MSDPVLKNPLDVARALAYGIEKLKINQHELYEALSGHVMDSQNGYTDKTEVLAEVRRVLGVQE